MLQNLKQYQFFAIVLAIIHIAIFSLASASNSSRPPSQVPAPSTDLNCQPEVVTSVADRWTHVLRPSEVPGAPSESIVEEPTISSLPDRESPSAPSSVPQPNGSVLRPSSTAGVSSQEQFRSAWANAPLSFPVNNEAMRALSQRASAGNHGPGATPVFVSMVNGSQKILNSRFRDTGLVDALNNYYWNLVLDEIRRLPPDHALRQHMVSSAYESYNGLTFAFTGVDSDTVYNALQEIHRRVGDRFRLQVESLNLSSTTAISPTDVNSHPELWHSWSIGQTLDQAELIDRHRRSGLGAQLRGNGGALDENLRPSPEVRRISRYNHGEVERELTGRVQSIGEILRRLRTTNPTFFMNQPEAGGTLQLRREIIDAYRSHGRDLISFRNAIRERLGVNVELRTLQELHQALEAANILSLSPIQVQRRSTGYLRAPPTRVVLSGDLVRAGAMTMEEVLRSVSSSDSWGNSAEIAVNARRAFDRATEILDARKNQFVDALTTTLNGVAERPSPNGWPVTIRDRAGSILAVVDASGDDILAGLRVDLSQEQYREFGRQLEQHRQGDVRRGHLGDFRITTHAQGALPQRDSNLLTGVQESLEKYIRRDLTSHSQGRAAPFTSEELRGYSIQMSAVGHDLTVTVLTPQNISQEQQNALREQVSEIVRLHIPQGYSLNNVVVTH